MCAGPSVGGRSSPPGLHQRRDERNIGHGLSQGRRVPMWVGSVRNLRPAISCVCLPLHRVSAAIRRSLRFGRGHPRRAFSNYQRGAENVCSVDQSCEDDGVLVLCRLRDAAVSCPRRCSLPKSQHQAGHTGRHLMAYAKHPFLDAQRADMGAYPRRRDAV
jgi:hypothetical protein